MSDLFKDIVPSILVSKKDILENEKDYNAFIVNRALSYHMDCVLYANEMNRLPNIDSKLQYHYLLNIVRGYKRRYTPWSKVEKSEDLETVQEYFGFSKAKAREALNILSPQQINEIKMKVDKGGVSNVDNRGHGRDNARRKG